MFYKHNLKHLGVKYSFPEILNKQRLEEWCVEVKKPSAKLLEFLASSNLKKNYHRANRFMSDRSSEVNDLFTKEMDIFLKQEKHNKEDIKYFKDFLSAHFSQSKYLRTLINELIGIILINAQNSPAGLKDDLKVRKIINSKQLNGLFKTLNLLSVAVEIMNAASYSADDAFDKTDLRYGVETVYKKHGHFAGTISADILFHYLGNYVFYKVIRQHEKAMEDAYLTKTGKVSTNTNPYSIKWEDKEKGIYVYINPEQYMDVWEVWTWAWYMINSGQIRDMHEFNLSNIDEFNVNSYAARAYRLSGGFIESISHLSSAFMGCGYWAGRQVIGKWATTYGTIVQVRNDYYDYVFCPPSDHKLIKETHEDISLGHITLPFGYAYQNANKNDKARMLKAAQAIVDKKKNGKKISQKDKIGLNNLIYKNNGFIASKKLVYNLTIWALEEISKLSHDFERDNYYWQLVAWTVAGLNIVNLSPEEGKMQEKKVNIFKVEEVYNYLNLL